MALAGFFMLPVGGFFVYTGLAGGGTDIQIGFGVLAIGQGFIIWSLGEIAGILKGPGLTAKQLIDSMRGRSSGAADK
jgi:hypothetical protein